MRQKEKNRLDVRTSVSTAFIVMEADMGATTRLTKIGNSTGITIPREVLDAAQMSRGEEVTLSVVEGKIEIAKPLDGYNEAMEIGRRFSKRYAKTMAALAK